MISYLTDNDDNANNHWEDKVRGFYFYQHSVISPIPAQHIKKAITSLATQGWKKLATASLLSASNKLQQPCRVEDGAQLLHKTRFWKTLSGVTVLNVSIFFLISQSEILKPVTDTSSTTKEKKPWAREFLSQITPLFMWNPHHTWTICYY